MTGFVRFVWRTWWLFIAGDALLVLHQTAVTGVAMILLALIPATFGTLLLLNVRGAIASLPPEQLQREWPTYTWRSVGFLVGGPAAVFIIGGFSILLR
jgi:hypothetical protein